MSKVPFEEARAAAQSLHEFVAAGRESQWRLDRWERDDPEAFRRRQRAATHRTEAERAGRKDGVLAKARQAAREYTVQQVAALCRQIVASQAPFAAWHFQVALRLRKGARRDCLVNKAIQNGWSGRQMQDAVMAVNGRRAHVGRRPQVPTDAVARLVQLEGLCLNWRRWCDTAFDDLPLELRALVTRANGAVGRVKEAAIRLRPEVQAGRKPPVDEGRPKAQDGSTGSKGAGRKTT
jgi:hypothetical protein